MAIGAISAGGRSDELSRLAVLSRAAAAPAVSLGPMATPPPNERFVVTAELPVVPIVYRDPRRSEVSAVRRGPTRTNEALPRRRRAPLALRVLVFVLLAVGLAATAGLVAEQIHPAWFESLRNVVVAPNAPSPRPIAVPRLPTGNLVLISTSPTGATYRIPASSYAISFDIDQRVWVRVERSPSEALLFDATLEASSRQTVVKVGGNTSVMVAARTLALSITEGARTLGMIRSPRVGYIYTFESTSPLPSAAT
jgi:hypothetical protein